MESSKRSTELAVFASIREVVKKASEWPEETEFIGRCTSWQPDSLVTLSRLPNMRWLTHSMVFAEAFKCCHVECWLDVQIRGLVDSWRDNFKIPGRLILVNTFLSITTCFIKPTRPNTRSNSSHTTCPKPQSSLSSLWDTMTRSNYLIWLAIDANSVSILGSPWRLDRSLSRPLSVWISRHLL